MALSIERLDHLVLTVKDIGKTCDFYSRVLGMAVITFGDNRKALAFGQQKINLQTLGQELRNRAGVGSGDLCLITVWALPDVMAHLAAEGVPLLEGPVTRSGAQGPIESLYFNDPDGNLVEVSVYPANTKEHVP